MNTRPRLRTAAALAAGALLATGAIAETSPYYIGAALSLTHDSNLLRIGKDNVVQAGYTKADTVTAASLVGGIDQPIGRQRVYGSVSVRDNRYANNSRFNNVGYNANLGLDWSTVERISGTVNATAARSLQSFNTGLVDTRDLETVKTIQATASIGVVTQYSFELSGGHRSVRNSEEVLKTRDFNQDNARAGVRWRPSGISSFALSAGTTRGSYPRFRLNPQPNETAEDRFRRTDLELSTTLKPTGASTVDARIAQGKTSYDLNTARNFSGTTGGITWGWEPTGKVRVTSSLTRDTGQDSYAQQLSGIPTTTDYSRLNTTARVAVDYLYSAKVTFAASVASVNADVVQTFGLAELSNQSSGRNRSTILNLSGRWVPQRWLLLGCELSSESRKGSGDSRLAYDLSTTSVGCYGQVTLQ